MKNLTEKTKGTSFQKSCEKILELLKNHKSAWPFKDPVKREEVPDYYDIIKNPIDLSKIQQNLKNGLYQTKEAFVNDVNLIFKNAKVYNQPHTIFYKYAAELELFAKDHLENLKEETMFEVEKGAENGGKKGKRKK